MKINQRNKPFISSDFLLSTYIYAKGHLLLEIEWISTSKAQFIFEDSASVKEDISNFWSGEAQIDAKTLLQAQKELKQRMYDSKN
jgi:hypothetical protein